MTHDFYIFMIWAQTATFKYKTG